MLRDYNFFQVKSEKNILRMSPWQNKFISMKIVVSTLNSRVSRILLNFTTLKIYDFLM